MKTKNFEKTNERHHNPVKRLLAIALSLAVFLTLLPVTMPVYKVKAANDTAAELLAPTVTDGKVTDAKTLEYAGKEWYVIASGGTGVQIASGAVTKEENETTIVLLAKENWGSDVIFHESNNTYGSSNLKLVLEDFVVSEHIGDYYSDNDSWKNALQTAAS